MTRSEYHNGKQRGLLHTSALLEPAQIPGIGWLLSRLEDRCELDNFVLDWARVLELEKHHPAVYDSAALIMVQLLLRELLREQSTPFWITCSLLIEGFEAHGDWVLKRMRSVPSGMPSLIFTYERTLTYLSIPCLHSKLGTQVNAVSKW